MFSASLACGTELTFEQRSFAPDAGDLVPCRSHGFCVVEAIAPVGAKTTPRRQRRRARRTTEELLDVLSREGVIPLQNLMRRRFTLRLIAAVERGGHVSVNWANDDPEVQLLDSEVHSYPARA